MAIERTESPFLGEAIFGTFDGLQSNGNGILAGDPTFGGIFEFRIGRGRESILHKLQDIRLVFFRRGCRIPGGEAVELLGYVAPCLDRTGREGFFGSCIAIRADQGSPHLAIYNWDNPRARARELIEEFSGNCDVNQKLTGLPRNLIPKNRFDDPSLELRLYGEGEGIFFAESDGKVDRDAVDALQSVAFMEGTSMTSMLLFHEKVKGATNIASPEIRKTSMEMELKIAERSARISETFSKSDRPIPTRGTSMNQRRSSVEERLRELEERVYELELGARPASAVMNAQTARRNRDTPFGSQSIFATEPTMLQKYGLWLGGGMVALLLLGGTLWFVFTPGEKTGVAAESVREITQNDGRVQAVESLKRVDPMTNEDAQRDKTEEAEKSAQNPN